MPVKSVTIRVDMQGAAHVENITSRVQNVLDGAGLRAGIVTVFIKHTTASIMIIEDEPGIRADTKAFWDRIIPADAALRHNTLNAGEDNGHSHLRGQLQGPSLVVPFTDRVLALGRWQQIVVVDFDTRSRTRDILIQIIGE